jgi:hypothetical protein
MHPADTECFADTIKYIIRTVSCRRQATSEDGVHYYQEKMKFVEHEELGDMSMSMNVFVRTQSKGERKTAQKKLANERRKHCLSIIPE